VSGSPRMLVAFTLATALVVGGVIALATGAWWVLVVAVLVHFAVTGFLLAFIWRRMDQKEKPDPVAETRFDDARSAMSR